MNDNNHSYGQKYNLLTKISIWTSCSLLCKFVGSVGGIGATRGWIFVVFIAAAIAITIALTVAVAIAVASASIFAWNMVRDMTTLAHSTLLTRLEFVVIDRLFFFAYSFVSSKGINMWLFVMNFWLADHLISLHFAKSYKRNSELKMMRNADN